MANSDIVQFSAIGEGLVEDLYTGINYPKVLTLEKNEANSYQDTEVKIVTIEGQKLYRFTTYRFMTNTDIKDFQFTQEECVTKTYEFTWVATTNPGSTTDRVD